MADVVFHASQMTLNEMFRGVWDQGRGFLIVFDGLKPTTNVVQRSRFWSKEVGSSLCAKCSFSCFLLPMKLITKAMVLMWPWKAATYCKTSATRDNIYMLHHSIQSMISPCLRLRGSAAKSIPNDESGEVQVLANRLQF